MPTTRIGDIELYYDESGSGEPLLLVMGLGADANAWTRQRDAFSQRHRTIVFDNRGVGRSSKPPGPYSTRQMAADAAALLDRLGIERAHVVGVSMGGMIAQELALGHAERVGTLVLVCTYPEPDGVAHATRENVFRHFIGASSSDASSAHAPSGNGASGSATNGNLTHAAQALAAVDPMTLFQYLLPTVFSERFIREELALLAPELTAGLVHGFSMEALLAQVGACMTHHTTDRLHRIDRPTLVLTGSDDRLIPPAHSDLLAARIPGARLVSIAGGTHGLNLEMADRFNAEVLDFLAAHPLAERSLGGRS